MATLKYGDYTFSPVAQVGIRDNTKRIGSSGLGAGSIERVITLKGKLTGENLNDVQTKIWALQTEFAKSGLTLYWHDGTTLRINTVAHPISVEIPEDWQQYEAEYTIRLSYLPLGETHYAPVTVTYNGYTFNPIPVIGREYSVNRDGDTVSRKGSKVSVTLQGFIDKGSFSSNQTELELLLTALATDGTLTFGSFVQAVRVGKLSIPPDVCNRRLEYSIVFDYDADIAGDGVKKISSTRQITHSYRNAIHRIPFLDYELVQQLGAAGQRIAASGFVVATSMANARTAAATEIAAQFPTPENAVEESRSVTEDSSQLRVDWNVSMFYPIPILTGGVYGATPVFP